MASWKRLGTLGKDSPEGALWGTSPSGVPIAVALDGGGLELSLFVLWRHGLHSAVRDALEWIDYEAMDVCAMADFLAAYGIHWRLSELLSRSLEATDYVLELEPEWLKEVGLDVADQVERGVAIARTVAAHRAAVEALRD